jgi:hypothetical protein
MVHPYARTIFDPKCQGSFTQRNAILQVVGAWHQGVRCADRPARRYKSGITEGRRDYSRVVVGGYCLSTVAQSFLGRSSDLVLPGVFRGVQRPIGAGEKLVGRCGAMP